MIDINQLLNTLKQFDFPGLLSKNIQLLPTLVLLYYCTNIFDILTKHVLIRPKFISLAEHLLLVNISQYDDGLLFSVEYMNLFEQSYIFAEEARKIKPF